MRFRLRQKTSGLLSVVYDTRFGTNTTATALDGWFVFGLRPSVCRQIWCNANAADDTGNGLTAATAKKTLPAAITVFKSGFTAGDQLMLAGTGSRSYTDAGTSGGWVGLGGFSATYPTAVLCYDPASPADTTKYGRLYGSDRPVVLLPSSGSFFSNAANGGENNFAVQGIILDAQNADSATISITFVHNNVIAQNCLFRYGAFQFDAGGGFSTGVHISKCGFYGQWQASSGNSQGTFFGGVDGVWLQDNTYGHCGWKLHSSRDDTTANGGTSVFGHANYYAAGNTNGFFSGNLYFDSATDGIGLRGDAIARQWVSWDDPEAGAISGYSGDSSEMPGGATIKVDDFAVLGADTGINLTTHPNSDGLSAINIKPGSYINNGVMIDSPNYYRAFIFAITSSSTSVSGLVQAYTISNVHTHNFTNQFAQSMSWATGHSGQVSMTWQNCLLDTLASTGTAGAGTISGTGVRTWVGGDYTNAYTRATLLTALGFSSKAAFVDTALDFPHLQWPRAILGILFSGYGLTPVYQTISVPSLAGLPSPTTVYNAALGNLTISTLNFVHNVASSALLSGASAGNFVLSSADLPTGFTLVGRLLSYSGSGASISTPTIHVLETSSDGLGTHTTAFTLNIS